MNFLFSTHKDIQLDPQQNKISLRSEVSITTVQFGNHTKLPVVPANMQTILTECGRAADGDTSTSCTVLMKAGRIFVKTYAWARFTVSISVY